MKKLIFITAILIGNVAYSQMGPTVSVNIIGGERFSNYIFHNSENIKSKDLGYVMHNSFGLNLEVENNRNIIRPELMFYQAGAKTKFNGVKMDWKTSHLALNFAYMYAVVDQNIFSLRPGIGLGANYMLSGHQNIGQSRVNIAKEKSLKRFDLEAQALLSGKFQVNPIFSIGAEYRFGIGLLNIEGDIDQKTRTIGHSVLVNLGFTFGSAFSPRY